MAANGRLPASMLAPIPGGRMRKDAAFRWNAMVIHIRGRTGVTILPTGSYSSYRDFAGQVLMRSQWCARGKCGNAAPPGSSNHGLGIACDTPRYDLVNAYGAPFGFSKRTSDAPWEPWHYRWNGSGPKPMPKPSRKTVAALLYRAGYLPKRSGNGAPAVALAVRRFQRTHYLTPDGVVGQFTLRALRSAPRKKGSRKRV